MINAPTCLSFFSGALGLDLGVEKAGFSIRSTSEIEKNSCGTIGFNRPDVPILGNFTNYSEQEIRQLARIEDDQEIDLIIGGPPCQSFSSAGKREGFSDPRGNAFLLFVDLIVKLQPKYVAIENVRGLLSAPMTIETEYGKKEIPNGALSEIISRFEHGGYCCSYNLYNTANFGVPQIRERVVLICSRNGIKAPYLEPTHSEDGEFDLPPWKTFQDVVSDLPKSPCDFIPFPEKRLKYYRMLKSGQNWRNLPVELQREALGGSFNSGGGKTGYLRRIAWNRPCPTLLTHPAMPATDLGHPEEDRPLSVQEYKRVQQFPDDWVIKGNVVHQYQ